MNAEQQLISHVSSDSNDLFQFAFTSHLLLDLTESSDG